MTPILKIPLLALYRFCFKKSIVFPYFLLHKAKNFQFTVAGLLLFGQPLNFKSLRGGSGYRLKHTAKVKRVFKAG